MDAAPTPRSIYDYNDADCQQSLLTGTGAERLCVIDKSLHGFGSHALKAEALHLVHRTAEALESDPFSGCRVRDVRFSVLGACSCECSTRLRSHSPTIEPTISLGSTSSAPATSGSDRLLRSTRLTFTTLERAVMSELHRFFRPELARFQTAVPRSRLIRSECLLERPGLHRRPPGRLQQAKECPYICAGSMRWQQVPEPQPRQRPVSRRES
jgi:hypothetical protein